MKKADKRYRPLMCLLFVLYAAAMVWLLFGQRWGTDVYTANKASAINLEPFATLKMYWHILQNNRDQALLRHAVINLVGNVVMFVPMGFYAPYLIRKMRKFLPAMLSLVFLIVMIETVQFVTCLGTCDIDDLILNASGVWIGWLIWRFRR